MFPPRRERGAAVALRRRLLRLLRARRRPRRSVDRDRAEAARRAGADPDHRGRRRHHDHLGQRPPAQWRPHHRRRRQARARTRDGVVERVMLGRWKAWPGTLERRTSKIQFCKTYSNAKSAALNGCVPFHSGCSGANAFTRSIAKTSWVYIGCSTHKVPSLSNVAMRSAGGTKSGPPCWVMRATKPVIARLLAPSFHDGSASLCACAGGKTGSMGANKIGSAAVAVSRARRLMPKGTDVGFMMPLPFVDERRSKARPGHARAGDI